ncbi:zf-TFIIB domain-containing protein [Nocardioides speluncae]|uniref:TFIIB-type zinc ribbon-containing protein n=1 Tax=Nocardioides speluncae TaxID=2670337 RepID=UPI001F0BBA33|nr:zf-TFIIB domain-containing protein [Nocardioides speluncae]
MNQQTIKCPKCPGMMRTYNRAGVHIEQCDSCRGIFLDYGELESISRAETQYAAAPPPPPPAAPAPPPPAQGYAQPGWGHQQPHYGHPRKHKSFAQMLFSS